MAPEFRPDSIDPSTVISTVSFMIGDSGFITHTLKPHRYHTEVCITEDQGKVALGHSSVEGGDIVVVYERGMVRVSQPRIMEDGISASERDQLFQQIRRDGYAQVIVSDRMAVGIQRVQPEVTSSQ